MTDADYGTATVTFFGRHGHQVVVACSHLTADAFAHLASHYQLRATWAPAEGGGTWLTIGPDDPTDTTRMPALTLHARNDDDALSAAANELAMLAWLAANRHWDRQQETRP